MLPLQPFWKQSAGQVSVSLTTVLQVGTGTQILVITLLIFALALLSGTFHPYSRGALLSSVIVLYAITAGEYDTCTAT